MTSPWDHPTERFEIRQFSAPCACRTYANTAQSWNGKDYGFIGLVLVTCHSALLTTHLMIELSGIETQTSEISVRVRQIRILLCTSVCMIRAEQGKYRCMRDSDATIINMCLQSHLPNDSSATNLRYWFVLYCIALHELIFDLLTCVTLSGDARDLRKNSTTFSWPTLVPWVRPDLFWRDGNNAYILWRINRQ